MQLVGCHTNQCYIGICMRAQSCSDITMSPVVRNTPFDISFCSWVKPWELKVLHQNILETGVLTRVVHNSSPTRRSRVGDEFWTTSVRTPISKMLSWRTVFSITTLLWDIGNLTAWSGIFPHPYALKACLDFHIATMSIFINVINSDVTNKFTK